MMIRDVFSKLGDNSSLKQLGLRLCLCTVGSLRSRYPLMELKNFLADCGSLSDNKYAGMPNATI